jgi:transposase
VPKPFPPEFRRDVVAVARSSDASMAQIARDFGISESCLSRWLKIADREDGRGDRPGGRHSSGAPTAHVSPAETASSEQRLRELEKRNRQLEQENEVLRRATAYFARDVLPK